MARFVNEAFVTGVFPSNINKDDIGKAVALTQADNTVLGKVPVDLTPGTAGGDNIYGVIIDSVEGNEARIQIRGIAAVRSSSAYNANQVGSTAVTSNTAGILQTHASSGSIHVTGGGTRLLNNAQHTVLFIDLDTKEA